MLKVGLTGSIGMGKSTVAQMFADLGAMVWNADDAVHRMYAKDGAAVGPVERAFPGVVVDGEIDRRLLAGKVLGTPAELQKLEAIVHPLVGADREAFMTAAGHAGADMVVLDIPLLFENGSDALFDVVIVVSAPAEIQRQRVLSRPGMTEAKLNTILAEQMPDEEKRSRADYIISTDQSLDDTKEDVAKIYNEIMARRLD
ncbi:MAG: dephospho-CoA kinase [Hyphococcus sp.]|nr:MAG: dephospho-CoA kinase [Marinicaulis sp.]